MRNLIVLIALTAGISSFARSPMPFQIHVWQCSAVNSGIDHGASIAVVQDSLKGLIATVTTQSIIGPRKLGEFKVDEVKPTVNRGNWAYLDSGTLGRFSLTITPAGTGKFRAVGKGGQNASGAVRCFRTRSL